VYARLTPSIGDCLIPSTISGARMCVASSSVGAMSIMWWNCERTPPASLITDGHEITMPCRVPPKCDATCFVHLNGVSKAHDHSTPMCGYVSLEPQFS